MVKREKVVAMHLTDREWSMLEKEANGKELSVAARELVVNSLGEGRGGTDGGVGDVLTEVHRVGSLVGELVIEFMLFAHGGDQQAAYTAAKDIFERAKEGGNAVHSEASRAQALGSNG